VRFADRGALERATPAERRRAALAWLSARSLERRQRRGGGVDVLASDLPVDAAYVRALAERGYRVRAVSRWLNAASVAVPRARLAELERLPFVAGVVPVPRYRHPHPEPEPADPAPLAPGSRSGVLPGGTGSPARVLSPGDPDFYGYSWAQNRLIQADLLHARGLSGAGVLVTILDSGFRETHVALDSLDVLARRDFVNGDLVVANEPGDPLDSDGHGTGTLSTLAGREVGVLIGTAYGATVALGKTEDISQEHVVEMDYWQMGAEWADSLGADVVSSSLGYFTFDNPAGDYEYADLDGATTVVTQAAVEAARRGITVVTAQGNEGALSWHYLIAPADADTACAVGAVDSFAVIASFSSYGPTADGRVKPDVCAMGVRVATATPSSDTQVFRQSGTSFSTPATAGLVALLLEANPGWGPYQVIEALRITADRYAAPDDRYGFGLARGELALLWATDSTGPGAAAASIDVLGANPVVGRAGTFFRFRAGAPGGPATVDVFDVRGRRVRRLWQGELSAGAVGGAAWDATDSADRLVPGGIYFVQLRAPGISATARVVVVS
jgi:subtilisin family serine protease